MDPICGARKLQQLLVIHDTVVKQIQQLENQTESISRRLFACDLNAEYPDNSLYHMRHSTTMGVKSVLESCRCRLIEQVKKISRQIIASIQADNTATIVEQTELESSNSPVMTDMAAIQYTSNIVMRFRRD